MLTSESQVILYVMYEGQANSRFDREYYVDRHLPLVMKAWHKHGLESALAFFPAITHQGTIAICECRFVHETAVTRAFSSEETAEVMADVIQFTDIQPKRYRATVSI